MYYNVLYVEIRYGIWFTPPSQTKCTDLGIFSESKHAVISSGWMPKSEATFEFPNAFSIPSLSMFILGLVLECQRILGQQCPQCPHHSGSEQWGRDSLGTRSGPRLRRDVAGAARIYPMPHFLISQVCLGDPPILHRFCSGNPHDCWWNPSRVLIQSHSIANVWWLNMIFQMVKTPSSWSKAPILVEI